jgi:hypothetical protein
MKVSLRIRSKTKSKSFAAPDMKVSLRSKTKSKSLARWSQLHDWAWVDINQSSWKTLSLSLVVSDSECASKFSFIFQLELGNYSYYKEDLEA